MIKYSERIYSAAEIKLIKEIFDMYIEGIYDEDLEDLINQCKEMFLDNQRLMKENKMLYNAINKAINHIKYHCIDDEFYINLSNKEKGIVDVLTILKNGVDKE